MGWGGACAGMGWTGELVERTVERGLRVDVRVGVARGKRPVYPGSRSEPFSLG